jgi:hypothetical protein
MDTYTQNENSETNETTDNNIKNICKYDNICNKDKICGDCGMDEYEKEKYNEAEHRFERKVWLSKMHKW